MGFLTGVTDHGSLLGLTDDDHPQYFLLAGRTGGQVGYGGTAATDTLTLSGNTGASGGHILLNPSNTGFVGIGTAIPSKLLSLKAAGLNASLIIEETGMSPAKPSFSASGFAFTDDTVFAGSPGGGTTGGYQFVGMTGATASAFPLIFNGIHGSTAPTSPAVMFRVGKHNGTTNITTLASTETVAIFRNWTNTPDLLTILGNGNVGIGIPTPGAKLEVADAASLAAETLTNQNLTGGTSWTTTNDMALAADKATYTHAIGGGTLEQASGTLAIAGKANRLYRFTYSVSGISGAAPTVTLTTAFAATAQTIDVSSNGGKTLYFRAAAAPGNFVINVVSTATGSFTLDSFALREIIGGNVIVDGLITGGGATGIKISGSGAVGIGTTAGAGALSINGGLHVGGDTDAGDNNLLVDGTGTITGAFGCNGKTAQTAYASGGAQAHTATSGGFGFVSAAEMNAKMTLLDNIRLALVAQGTMS